MSDDQLPGKVGYRSLPQASRFVKGQSGNPRGRPEGRQSEIPYEAVLGRKVNVRDGDVERMVTAAEAFLLQLTRLGLSGENAAMRASLDAIANSSPILIPSNYSASETPKTIFVRFEGTVFRPTKVLSKTPLR